MAEQLDLRDLSEHEVAWLEGVSVTTVRQWRHQGQGRGPDYRNQGGVRYPIRWYLEWRDQGRQSGTARALAAADERTCRLPRNRLPRPACSLRERFLRALPDEPLRNDDVLPLSS